MTILKNIYLTSPKSHLVLAVILSLPFYIWGIWELDAIRQGTEGFYLQISKEMFETGSFLTPHYLGNEHWSKPPLHFWLPIPLYYINLISTHTAARCSIVTLSLWGIYVFSKWMSRHFETNRALFFVFLASSFGFIKYSRIFMMEMPLTIFSILASLYFFDFILSNRKSDGIKSVIFLTMATLIKGPVALVMCGASCGAYVLYEFFFCKNNIIKKYIVWISLSLLLSSVWFLLSYLKHGFEFIEYFFIRENLGKFSAKSYPLRTLFQGLFIYSLPWCLFSPLLILFFVDKKNRSLSNKKNRALYFLLINFIIFFVLWFFPSQKSHHYAIPSLPFFLSIIFLATYKESVHQYFKKTHKIINALVAFFLFLLAVTISAILNFKEVHSSASAISVTVIIIIVLLISSFLFIKNSSPLKKSCLILLCLGGIWTFFLPSFFLPTVPAETRSTIDAKHRKVAIVYRKPFFIEQAINQKVTTLDRSNIINYIDGHNELYLLHETLYRDLKLSNSTIILHRWPVWKRGNKLSDILGSFNKSTLEPLKEYLVLLENRP